MNPEELRSFFGWMTIINVAFLLYWWLVIAKFRKAVYRMHRKWFPITDDQFNGIHYGGMAVFKLAITLLNFAPWLALTIMQ